MAFISLTPVGRTAAVEQTTDNGRNTVARYLAIATLTILAATGAGCSWQNKEHMQIDASQQPAYGRLPGANERFQVDPSDPTVGQDYRRDREQPARHWNQKVWEEQGYPSNSTTSSNSTARDDRWNEPERLNQARRDDYSNEVYRRDTSAQDPYGRTPTTSAYDGYERTDQYGRAESYDTYGRTNTQVRTDQWGAPQGQAYAPSNAQPAPRPVVTQVRVRPLDQTQTGTATVADYTLPVQTSSYTALPTIGAIPDYNGNTGATTTTSAPVSIEDAARTNVTAMPLNYSTDDAIKTLEHVLASDPDNAKIKLALQALYAAEGRQAGSQTTDRATEAMALAVQALDQAQADDPEAAARALDLLEELHDELAQHAELIIENVRLCSGVEDFGKYHELSKEELASGEPRRIVVYCELKNFKSEVNADGKYVTRLRAQILLYDDNMNVLTPQPPTDVMDTPASRPRRDFFLHGTLDLPPLPSGSYSVVIKIEDRLAEKIARDGRVDFEVTGKPTGLP